MTFRGLLLALCILAALALLVWLVVMLAFLGGELLRRALTVLSDLSR